MEKVINLDDDLVFKHSVEYNDQVQYKMIRPQSTPLEMETYDRAKVVRETICELVIRGKLDATDLKIIQARDCSPMPTQEEVGRIVGISQPAVNKRVIRFRSLFATIKR